MSRIFELLSAGGYEELVFAHDRPSGLRALIGLHDTTLGPAMGGVRMYPYETEDDAVADCLRMARNMTYKAAAAGLNLGGGAAVLMGDPARDKNEAMLRAFGRAVESLNGRFIAAEERGTDIWDMEYVRVETRYVTGLTKGKGGSGDPSPVTAYGVYQGIKACAAWVFEDASLRNRRIGVQGVGAVGHDLTRYLTSEGAQVFVADPSEDALQKVRDDFGATVVPYDEIYDQEVDVFAPCAQGGVINDDTLSRLRTRIVAGAANNQLQDEERHGQRLHELGICYAPDFVINAGGLMNVYEELEGYNRERALQKVSQLFYAITDILRTSRHENIPTYRAANQVAERRIEVLRDVKRTYLPSTHKVWRAG